MRKKNRMASVISIILINGLVLSAFPIVAENTNPTEPRETINSPQAEMVLQNDSLQLIYDYTRDLIEIKNKTDNKSWYSFPVDADTDTTAQGSIKRELTSNLVVEYIDEKNNDFVANSNTASVSQGTYTAYKTPAGLLVEYDFSRKKEEFIIPVLYSLDQNGFTAKILFDKIKEYGSKKICEVRLMPYFGAGKKGTDGFLFLPDGSGATVDFKAEKGWAESYRKQIYGRDPSKSDYIYSTGEEQIYLPVYGICQSDGAFLGLVEHGDGNAFIEGVQAGKSTDYASAFCAFPYRQLDNMKLYDKYGTEKNITFESKKVSDANPLVRYWFAGKKDANLAGMAALYRNYLIQEKNFGKIKKSTDAPLYLDVFGASEKKESVLGFLVDKTVTATTMKDLNDIAARLSELKINNMVILLEYFNKKGTGSGVIRNFSIDSAIGSKQEFRKFAEQYSEKGIKLFYGINNINVKRGTFLWWEFNSGATNLIQTKLAGYEYKKGINAVNKKNKLYFYLMPQKLTDILTNRSFRSFKSAGLTGISFLKTSSVLYSDNKISHYSSREDTIARYREIYEQAVSGEMGLLSEETNAYCIPYSKYITNVPVSSSGFDIMTRAVPFYQMVFHGLREFSSLPVNTGYDPGRSFLECMLTGTGLHYSLTGESSIVLKDTQLNYLLSTNYRDWIDEINKNYKTYNAVHKELQDKLIVGYEQSGNIEKMVYEDGTVIAVNHGSSQEQIDGRTVRSNDFITYKQEVEE